MCRPLSFYAAETHDDIKIWVSEHTDYHIEIAEEYNLRDDGKHRLYAGEFYPDDHDMAPSPDTTTWRLAWDSAATLACREKPDDEFADRVRQRLERLAQRYICTRGEQIVVARGWAFGDVTQTVNDGEGWACDKATQTVNNGLGWACDKATQTVNNGVGYTCDNATQTVNGGEGQAYDNAMQTVNGGWGWAYENTTQTVNDGVGYAYGYAKQTVNGGEGYVFGDATQIDNRPRREELPSNCDKGEGK